MARPYIRRHKKRRALKHKGILKKIKHELFDLYDISLHFGREIYLRMHSLYAVILVLFTGLAVVMPVYGTFEEHQLLLSATSFISTIILVFFLTGRRERVIEIRDAIFQENASYINAHILSKEFTDKKFNSAKLIDDYLVKNMTLELEEYKKSNKEFYKFYDSFRKVEVKTPKQRILYEKVIEELKAAEHSRDRIINLLQEYMSPWQWTISLTLVILMIISLFILRGETLISKVSVGLLSSAVVLLVFMIKNLDDLHWAGEIYTIEPYAEVFDIIGKKRYYVDYEINLRKIKPPTGEYRLGITERDKYNRPILKKIIIVKNPKKKSRTF